MAGAAEDGAGAAVGGAEDLVLALAGDGDLDFLVGDQVGDGAGLLTGMTRIGTTRGGTGHRQPITRRRILITT